MTLFSFFLCSYRHLRLRRKLSYAAIGLIALFAILRTIEYTPSVGSTSIHSKPLGTNCEISSKQRRQLFSLLNEVDTILGRLSITHFLCYDSLWGVVQESGPLPWDPSANLCILGSHLKPHDEASFYRAFLFSNLSVEYSSADGEYTIKKESATADANSPFVKLYLFEDDERLDGLLRRVGWKRRLLPADCEAQPLLQCFPSSMVSHPLPLKSFGPLSLPCPRQEVELLKRLYPNSWWKPRRPSC